MGTKLLIEFEGCFTIDGRIPSWIEIEFIADACLADSIDTYMVSFVQKDRIIKALF